MPNPWLSEAADTLRDAFISPKPDNATGFDDKTCTWIVPRKEELNA
jgi:hypothetical protein